MKYNNRIIYIFIYIICSGFLYNKNPCKVDSLKLQLKKSKEDTLKVNLLNLIGSDFLQKIKMQEALFYFTESELLANKLNFQHGLLVSLNCSGLTHLYLNEKEKALKFFTKALLLSQQIKDKKSEADICSNLGILHNNMAKYSKALEYNLIALTIREKISDEEGVNISKTIIANIYYYQENYLEALKMYLDIISTPDIEKNEFNYAQIQYNTALVYFELKEYNNALKHLNIAIKIEVAINDMQGVALSYNIFSSIYTAQKNYDDALLFSKKGISILVKLNDTKGLTEAYGNIGVTYDSLKLYDQAETVFEKQLDLSKKINYSVNEMGAYLNLSNHYNLKQEYELSLKYYKLYKQIQLNIKDESNTKMILELETKYKIKNKEAEIRLLKVRQQLDKDKNNRQKQLLWSVLIVVTLILLSVFLLFNRQQLKNKNLLIHKNHELERDALSAQMNPHFIFNSLGSISGFIAENNRNKALEYIQVFSKLIRHNLEQSREQFISVLKEAEMLESYLILEQVRYNQKFNFEIAIDQQMNDAIALPPMFVQPFVENAILHGVIPSNRNGLITIKFFCLDNEKLVCEIEDNGIGKTESLKRKTEYIVKHNSLAITIVQKRINILNSLENEKIEFMTTELKNENNIVTGTLVKLIFPLEYI